MVKLDVKKIKYLIILDEESRKRYQLQNTPNQGTGTDRLTRVYTLYTSQAFGKRTNTQAIRETIFAQKIPLLLFKLGSKATLFY